MWGPHFRRSLEAGGNPDKIKKFYESKVLEHIDKQDEKDYDKKHSSTLGIMWKSVKSLAGLKRTNRGRQSGMDGFEINELLVERIFRLFALLRRGPRISAGEGGNQPGGRPSAQNRILLMLNESDGISQRDMTMLLQLRPQSVSQTLGKLEAGGLLERRQNARDKRVFNIFLTEEGKLRAAELVKDRPDFAAEFLMPLSELEKRELFDILGKLTAEEPDDGFDQEI